jgi:hypothetical protein
MKQEHRPRGRAPLAWLAPFRTMIGQTVLIALRDDIQLKAMQYANRVLKESTLGRARQYARCAVPASTLMMTALHLRALASPAWLLWPIPLRTQAAQVSKIARASPTTRGLRADRALRAKLQKGTQREAAVPAEILRSLSLRKQRHLPLFESQPPSRPEASTSVLWRSSWRLRQRPWFTPPTALSRNVAARP